MSPEDPQLPEDPSQWTRRTFVTRAGTGTAMLSLSALIAACGGGSRSGGAATTASGHAAPKNQKRGGSLVFAVDSLQGNAEPGIFASLPDWMAIDLMARGLTQTDFTTGHVNPALAERWEISRDGRTYLFHLRQGATFHDGERVTAKDFKRSWDRLFNPKDPTAAPGTSNAIYLGGPNVASYKALGDDRFEVRLVRPDVAFVAKCGVQAAVVLSSRALQQRKKKIGQHLVAAGPFEFVDFTQDQNLRLKRFEGYWGQKAFLDTLVLQIIPDATALANGLSTGAVQASSFVPPANLASVGKAVIDRPKQYTIQLAFLNVAAESLKDLRVRQAINLAIDRDAIIRSGFAGYAQTPGYVIPSADLGYSDSLKVLSSQDLSRAKGLVQQASAQGKQISVLAPNNRWWPDVGQIVERNLQQIGLSPKMEYVEQSAFNTKELDPKQHEVVLDTYAAILADPEDAAFSIFKSDQFYSQTITQGFTLKEVSRRLDRLIQQGREETDSGRRAQIYESLQKVAANDLMAVSVLAYASPPVVHAPNVVGLDVNALGTYRAYLEGTSLA